MLKEKLLLYIPHPRHSYPFDYATTAATAIMISRRHQPLFYVPTTIGSTMLKDKLGTPADQPFPAIMIGAGLNKDFNNPGLMRQYSEAARQFGGAVVVGSITVEKRSGNKGVLWWPGKTASLNAYGMPNPGLEGMPSKAPFDNLIVSIAGFSVAEYIRLYNELWNWGLGIELNFGCPNTGEDKDIFSFDDDAMAAVLSHIQRQYVTDPGRLDRILGVKLSPYSNPSELRRVADMLSQFERTVDYVATCNTFPNGMAYEESGDPAIYCEQTDNMGGISGPALAEMTLGQAKQFRKRFTATGTSMGIVRVGGVHRGKDLRDSEREELDGVQMVTAVQDRPGRVADIVQQYAA